MENTFYENPSGTPLPNTVTPTDSHIHVLPPPPHHSSALKTLGIVFGILFIMITSAGGGYLLSMKNHGDTQAISEKKVVVTPSPIAVITPTIVEQKQYISSPSADANWNVYTHHTNGYSIMYPSTWTVGENYFSPPGVTPGYGYSAVAIRFSDKQLIQPVSSTLEQYAKDNAGMETAPSRTPKNITKITTNDGDIGYTIEWETDLINSSQVGGRTTLFAKPTDENTILEIEGGEKYVTEYTQMIKSLTFTK